jgi:hypothetical protein
MLIPLGILSSSGGALEPVAGYSLWLDASDASTFSFSTGSFVSQWRDKSANAYHFAQATAGFQPERQLAVQNGLASVYFNADNLNNNSWNWSTSAFTVIAVVKNRNPGSYDGILSRDAVSSLQLGYDNINRYAISRVSLATSSTNLTGTASNADVVVYKSSGIASGNVSVQVYKNGTAATSAVSLTSIIAGGPNTLGATLSGGIDPMVGYISEMVVYPSQLSDSDRNTVEGYLKAKWATP